MRYFSKSPEEWEKYDELRKKEKEQKEKAKKRIIRWTFYIIIFLSLLTIVFIFIGRENSRLDLPHNVVIKGINIYLQAEEDYYYPNVLDIKVILQNTNNKETHIKIENFSFLIINKENAQIIYSFAFPDTVETTINPFQTILIFDLLREKEIKTLNQGVYEARATFTINGQNINLNKSFKYNQDLFLDIQNKEMFYLSDEFPTVDIILTNRTNQTFDSELNGELIIKNRDVEIYSQSFSFGKMNIEPLSSTSLNFKIGYNLDPGTYYLVFNFDPLNQSYVTTLNIVDSIEQDIEDLDLIVYAISTANRGDQLFFEGLLRNSKKRERAFEISKIVFKLFHEDKLIYNYENTDIMRVYIPELGASKVFDIANIKSIVLDRSGRYNIQFMVESHGNIFSKDHTFVVY